MLYIIGTPIGNLEDITLRALRILREVDLVACEDTRRTSILLSHYEIKKPLVSYHSHSKLQKIDFLLNELSSGKNIALVTDAGMPGISDPGSQLIGRAIEANINVDIIPGPDAVSAILGISGISFQKFLFLGFLPKKKGRNTLFTSLKDVKYPVIIYESPFRIIKTLQEIKNILGDRKVVIGRELTKKFQEILRGKVSEVISQVRPQGEFVVIFYE